MKRTWFTLLILIVSFCVFASAKGKSKDEKGDKPGKKGMSGITSISTCMTQEVQFNTAEIESAVEGCLAGRLQEIQEQVEAEVLGNTKTNAKKKEKVEKKLAKKKQKLEKKVRQKCVSECEWNLFDLIPAMNGTSNGSSSYPSVEIPGGFLERFPLEARESLKTGMESCYNLTSPSPVKNGKKFKLKKACLQNKKLIKCFGKTIRKTCNGKTSNSSVQPSINSTDAPVAKSDLEIVPSPTSNIPAAPADDEEGDDEDDDDDDLDDDDEEEAEDSTTISGVSVSVTTKSSMPASEVDTSQPITK